MPYQCVCFSRPRTCIIEEVTLSRGNGWSHFLTGLARRSPRHMFAILVSNKGQLFPTFSNDPNIVPQSPNMLASPPTPSNNRVWGDPGRQDVLGSRWCSWLHFNLGWAKAACERRSRALTAPRLFAWPRSTGLWSGRFPAGPPSKN